MSVRDKKRVADFESKQTEHCGNVQLNDFYTDDVVEIRKIFVNAFENLPFVDSYYFIVHDTNHGEDSNYIHVHFIILLKCQIRCSTLCNKIAELLHVNTLAVSDDKLISIVAMLKYFLHMTEESKEDGKKQYEPYEIISNDSDLIIKGYLESESDDNVSIRLIRQLVIECDIKSDVLIKLGSDKLVKKNRYYIDTLWNDKATLMLRQDRYNDDMPFDSDIIKR